MKGALKDLLICLLINHHMGLLKEVRHTTKPRRYLKKYRPIDLHIIIFLEVHQETCLREQFPTNHPMAIPQEMVLLKGPQTLQMFIADLRKMLSLLMVVPTNHPTCQ